MRNYSQKLENLVAALRLYFAHYNFVRVHGSLRQTPSMAANVTDHPAEGEQTQAPLSPFIGSPTASTRGNGIRFRLFCAR